MITHRSLMVGFGGAQK